MRVELEHDLKRLAQALAALAQVGLVAVPAQGRQLGAHFGLELWAASAVRRRFGRRWVVDAPCRRWPFPGSCYLNPVDCLWWLNTTVFQVSEAGRRQQAPGTQAVTHAPRGRESPAQTSAERH